MKIRGEVCPVWTTAPLPILPLNTFFLSLQFVNDYMRHYTYISVCTDGRLVAAECLPHGRSGGGEITGLDMDDSY